VAANSKRVTATLALAALVLSYCWLVQPSGDNQNAHYALTRALADGRPHVDEIRSRGPERLHTNDVVEFEGHWYAAKAPGLAAASLPAYAVVDAAGMETNGDPYRVQWVLHLWSVVLPAMVLLVLVWRLGDRVAPGAGIAAAAILGAATLLLPFAQLLFAHVLATALGFAAFALLWREREGLRKPVIVALAGVLAGLAVTVDYPLGLVAIALGLYALAAPGTRTRKALMYGAGLAAGVLPAFAFNWWAFGSPLHFPYEGWTQPGEEPYPGVFGVNRPNLSVLLELLFVPAGIAPVLAPALVGLVAMWRRGLRPEALLIGSLAVAYVLYNASSSDPFGGASPGPRYLVPLLPFIAVPVAGAVRVVPGLVVGLAIGAGSIQALYSATSPLAAWDGHAWERLRAGSVVRTVVEPLDLPAWLAVLPFGFLLLAAAAAALLAASVRLGWGDAAVAAIALAGWALVTWQAPRFVYEGHLRELALLALVAGAAAIAAAAARSTPRPPTAVPADSPPLQR
jgi:4-amino-4-deoxy-L-arabinose transferase-like glycosyltransferase